MLFNTLTFFALFLPTLITYWLLPWQRFRLILLLVSSLVFYAYHHWPSVILLIFTITFNYAVGKLQTTNNSKFLMIFAVIANFSILAWFKYAAFFAQNINFIFGSFKVDIALPIPPTFLPLGISFFTFQVVAYQIDIYRREVKAEQSFLTFAVFKCFFPQLIAGPIVRAKDFLPQLHKKVYFDAISFHQGLWLILAGLALKIGVADVLAQFADNAFKSPEKLSTIGAWTGLYAYAFQLYADFWGYSTIAVGLAALFGLALPLNFDTPYASLSIQEFWRRWHITLSAWLKDYVYIPLGGNRHNQIINLLITMSLAGLWHGAGWAFIIWGFGHGIWLILEHKFTINNKFFNETKLGRFLRLFLVFHCVCLLWVFFRASSVSIAGEYFARLLLPPFNTSEVPTILISWLVIFAIFQKRLANTFSNNNFVNLSLKKQWMLCLLSIYLILVYAGARVDFIYFTF